MMRHNTRPGIDLANTFKYRSFKSGVRGRDVRVVGKWHGAGPWDDESMPVQEVNDLRRGRIWGTTAIEEAHRRYFFDRGISLKRCIKYRIQTIKDPADVNGQPIIAMPFFNHDMTECHFYQKFSKGDKKRNPRGLRPVLFNCRHLYRQMPVIVVTESPVDALSIETAYPIPAVSIVSASGVKLLEKALDDFPDFDGKFITFLDNDAPGRKAAAEVRACLAMRGLEYIDIYDLLPELLLQLKDPNEMLMAYEAVLSEVLKTAEEVVMGVKRNQAIK